MKIFKTYTFLWWQMGVLKIGLLAIGAAAGAWWFPFFRAHISALIGLGGVAVIYILFISFTQMQR